MSNEANMPPPSIPPAERGPLWHAVFAAAFVQDREAMLEHARSVGRRIDYDGWIREHSYGTAEIASGIADAAVLALARVDEAGAKRGTER